MSARESDINLKALDSLRGLLAVYVVAGHARWLLWTGNSEWSSGSHPLWQDLLAKSSALFRYGHEAVMGFFVLSGFFIHLRASQDFNRSQTVGFDVAKYAQRRVHRLLPPYALALVVTVALDVIGRRLFPALYLGQCGDDLLTSSFTRMGYDAASVVPAMLLLPSSLGQHFGTNGPLWSLAYEVVYYALYPVWLGIRIRYGTRAFAILPLVVIIGATLLDAWPALVLSHYSVWLTGAMLAEIVTSQRGSSATPARLVMVAAAAFGLHHLPWAKQLPVELALAAVYGGALVWMAALLPDSVTAWQPVKWLEYFGVRSYTLYVVHFPWLALISAWAFHTWGTRPASGWLALGGFTSALGVGWLCFHLCERKFLHPRIRLA